MYYEVPTMGKVINFIVTIFVTGTTRALDRPYNNKMETDPIHTHEQY